MLHKLLPRKARIIPVGLVVLLMATASSTTTWAQGMAPSDASEPAAVADSEPRPSYVSAIGDQVAGSEPTASTAPGPSAEGWELPPARVMMGPLDVISESIFGEASAEEWQPLSLSTFFSEGWDRPWVRSPVGTRGGLKQNWFGAADATFVRLSSINFFNVIGMTTNYGLLLTPLPWAPAKPTAIGNEYWASYNLYLPLNQRLELLVVVPFIASNANGAGNYVGNFGDLTLSERFRLIEQRNFTLLALLTERMPTGQTVNGNDINFITPSLDFWWNFAQKWVVRGSTGMNIDTGRHSATSVYFNNLAIGRYLTNRDARVFKELAAHLSVTTLSDLLGRKGYITDVYIAPGFRFGLDRELKWSVLGAALFPVSGPHPYAWQPMFSLVRNF